MRQWHYMKSIARALAIISVIALPLAVSAQTQDQVVTDLQAQAKALLDQVALLQAQAGGSSGVTNVAANGTSVGSYGTSGGGVDSSTCPNIGRVLKLGSSGDDVRRLQQFLAQDVTVYPGGSVTGYYGALTEAAVKRWQSKYQIVSSGSPSATGYGVTGPRTAAAIALLCSTRGPSGGSTSAPVGGFIQVSPVSGNAPLGVTVTATVNTTNSCTGANYTLNFGDGTQVQNIPVPPNNCAQVVQNYSHTYLYGGTYLVTLSAGSHKTTASVVVYGQTAPITGPDQNTQQHASFSASPLSGQAPLQVVFYTWIPTIRPANAGAYQINFGDGATSQASYCSGNDYCTTPGQNGHTYTAAGTYVAQLISSVSGPVGNVTVTVGAPNPNAANGGYGIISVSPLGTTADGSGINAVFAVPPSTAYQISWGDNTPVSTATASSQATDQNGVVFNASHTYTTGGSYTISLKDGNGNTKASAAVTITL